MKQIFKKAIWLIITKTILNIFAVTSSPFPKNSSVWRIIELNIYNIKPHPKKVNRISFLGFLRRRPRLSELFFLSHRGDCRNKAEILSRNIDLFHHVFSTWKNHLMDMLTSSKNMIFPRGGFKPAANTLQMLHWCQRVHIGQHRDQADDSGTGGQIANCCFHLGRTAWKYIFVVFVSHLTLEKSLLVIFVSQTTTRSTQCHLFGLTSVRSHLLD